MRTRIFFVTDVHGSDTCFRKFINAGRFYKADVLILGGDVTGKMIVPITRLGDGTFECDYEGKVVAMRSEAGLEKTMANIRDSGYYPHIATSDEVERLARDPALLHQLFVRLMKESLSRWLSLARERLDGTNIACYISPGNDDFFEIDDVLDAPGYAINPEGRVVDIDGQHEMITMGYTNRTPWNSPREVDEATLKEKMEGLIGRVKDMKTAIFNVHVPPVDTPIDQAPKLDANLRPTLSAGSPVLISAGSSAVRECIEKSQPLIGLHGHIHEARGVVKIGRTVCFNPGSEYNSGVLRGLLCDLEDNSVRSYLFTSG